MTPETVAESSKAGNTTRDVWLACAFPGTKLSSDPVVPGVEKPFCQSDGAVGAVGGEHPVTSGAVCISEPCHSSNK